MSDTQDMHFRRLRVRLETERHVIEGTLQLPSEGYRSRMTDFLNSHDSDFLPITEADVTWVRGGRPPAHHQYLAGAGAPAARGARVPRGLRAPHRGRRRAGVAGNARRGGSDAVRAALDGLLP